MDIVGHVSPHMRSTMAQFLHVPHSGAPVLCEICTFAMNCTLSLSTIPRAVHAILLCGASCVEFAVACCERKPPR